MYEKNLNISLLLDFYGELLPPKQRDFLDLYYNEDLSLSEIAENAAITRQGVHDSIKKGEETLLELEQKLALRQRFTLFHQTIAQMIADWNAMKEKYSSQEELQKDIEKMIDSAKKLVI